MTTLHAGHPLPPLVLASVSPRRRHLLGLFGIPFTVVPGSVDESRVAGAFPEDFARNAARAKALDVARGCEPDALVLGADTIVVLDVESTETALTGLTTDGNGNEKWSGFRPFPDQGQFVLGKPSGGAEATEMLRRLSGRTHHVITGVALCRKESVLALDAETTAVRFRTLDEGEIAAYIATGEPLDKAGSYGIQGRAEKFIESVEGDLANVIGLPLPLVYRMLRGHYPELAMPSRENLTEAYREG